MQKVRDKIKETLELLEKQETNDFSFWENSGYATADPNSDEVYFLLSHTTFQEKLEAEDAAIFSNHATQRIELYAKALGVALDFISDPQQKVFDYGCDSCGYEGDIKYTFKTADQIKIKEKITRIFEEGEHDRS